LCGIHRPTIAERLDDRGHALDQLGRGLAVLGRALRDAKLADEEVEERRIAQLGPCPALVEVSECDESSWLSPSLSAPTNPLVTSENGPSRAAYTGCA